MLRLYTQSRLSRILLQVQKTELTCIVVLYCIILRDALNVMLISVVEMDSLCDGIFLIQMVL